MAISCPVRVLGIHTVKSRESNKEYVFMELLFFVLLKQPVLGAKKVASFTV